MSDWAIVELKLDLRQFIDCIKWCDQEVGEQDEYWAVSSAIPKDCTFKFQRKEDAIMFLLKFCK